MRDDEFEWDARKAKGRRAQSLYCAVSNPSVQQCNEPLCSDQVLELILRRRNKAIAPYVLKPDEDRELITGLAGDVLLTVCLVELPQTHHLGPKGNIP